VPRASGRGVRLLGAEERRLGHEASGVEGRWPGHQGHRAWVVGASRSSDVEEHRPGQWVVGALQGRGRRGVFVGRRGAVVGALGHWGRWRRHGWVALGCWRRRVCAGSACDSFFLKCRCGRRQGSEKRKRVVSKSAYIR
jgi:hypothetical protein